jgi:hypothetical protein
MLFLAISAHAQVNDSTKNKVAPNPYSFHFTAGSSFMAGSGFSAMNTYVAPEMNYSLNKKFTLIAGFAIVNTNFHSSFAGNKDLQTKPFASNYTSSFVYAGGKYKLNDRITLSGAAYTQVNTFENPDNNNNAFDKNVKGAALGVDYKLSEKSSIGIELNFSNGHSPFGYNNNSCFPTQQSYFGRQ